MIHIEVMPLRALIVLSLLIMNQAAHGCLWIHGTTVRGTFEKREGRWGAVHLKTPMNSDVREAEHLFKRHQYSPPNASGTANDEAVQTLLRGDAATAVKMLEKEEAERPGNYYTAANLGTAYELAGDDAKALEWIRTGIQRNPASHMRAEWLHVRILEAKLNLKTQADWLKKHTITGVDMSRLEESGYQISTAQGDLRMDQVKGSLYEQLSVRMLLVKPKDFIVAQLLVELAQMEHVLGFQEPVVELLDMAVIYGQPEINVADLRTKAQELLRWTWLSKALHNSPKYLIPIAIFGSLGGIALILIVRGYRRLFKTPAAS
ncbi:MAG: hypothetical protein V4662_18525 [Verrucomicrobiota bacterium]